MYFRQTSTPLTPNNKFRQRHHTYNGSGSDATFLSTDSPTGRYSLLTHVSQKKTFQ